MSLTAVWIGAGVAMAGALLAAGTAQWRLRVQLRHDRALHDLGELRAVVDEAAAMTYTAVEKLIDAMQAAEVWANASRFDQEKGTAARSARHEAFVAIWPMENMAARLALRVTEGHSIYVAFQTFHHGCKAVAHEMPYGTAPDILQPDRWEALRFQLRHDRAGFIRAAHHAVATRLPPRADRPRLHTRVYLSARSLLDKP